MITITIFKKFYLKIEKIKLIQKIINFQEISQKLTEIVSLRFQKKQLHYQKYFNFEYLGTIKHKFESIKTYQ